MKLLGAVKKFSQSFKLLIVPIVLASVLVLQAQAFVLFLKIADHPYWVRASIATFGAGLLLYGIAALLYERMQTWYLIVISLLTSIFFIAEFLYFSYSGGFLQSSALLYASQAFTVTGTVMALLTPKLLIFMVNIPIVLWCVFRKSIRNTSRMSLTAREKMMVLLLIIVGSVGCYGTLLMAEQFETGDAAGLYRNDYDLDTLVAKIGIVNFFGRDTLKLIAARAKVSAQDVEFVKEWSARRAHTVARAPSFGVGSGRNLIIIQIESLENALIGTRIGGEEITPTLNALSKQGLYFSNYFALIEQGTTADAEFVTQNSLYPLPETVPFLQYAHNTYSALPDFLKKNGYHTAVLHGDVSSFWNRANMYPQLGYETVRDNSDYTISRPIGYYKLGDEDFFHQSIPYLAQLKAPFMATVMTLSSHTPFVLPADLQTLAIPDGFGGLSSYQRDYLQSVHYTDRAIGAFIAELKKKNLYDTSVIAIIGDHGSFTGVSDALHVEQNTPSDMRTHQVPLIILVPGAQVRGTIMTPASHLDLYPTLSHLLSIEYPSSVLGRDALAPGDAMVVFRKPITGSISSIMSESLIYTGGDDGVFESGLCALRSSGAMVPLDACQSLYDAAHAQTKASDIVVHGNRIDLLSADTR